MASAATVRALRSSPVGDIGIVTPSPSPIVTPLRVLKPATAEPGDLVVPQIRPTPPVMPPPPIESPPVNITPGANQVIRLAPRPPAIVGLDDVGSKVVVTDKLPTFCTGSSESEIERAFKGDLSGVKYDLTRQKDATNPAQCETARVVDLLEGKQYRESPVSLLKNIGAGFVNSIIPGSDLGNRGSSTQMVGGLIAGVAAIGAGSAGVIGGLTQNSKNVSTLGNLINGANTFLTSPLGQIGTNFLGSIIPKGPIVGAVPVTQGPQRQPAVSSPGSQIGVSPLTPVATLIPGWGIKIESGTKYPTPVPITQPYGTTNAQTPSPAVPSWVYILAAAVVGFMLLKKR